MSMAFSISSYKKFINMHTLREIHLMFHQNYNSVSLLNAAKLHLLSSPALQAFVTLSNSKQHKTSTPRSLYDMNFLGLS